MGRREIGAADGFNHLKEVMEPRMAELGMSVESLVQSMQESGFHLNRSTVYHWFRDRSRPVPALACGVAKILGLAEEALLAAYSRRRYTPVNKSVGVRHVRGSEGQKLVPSRLRSRIAPILQERLAQMNYDTVEAARAIGCTYEYARLLLSGARIPSLIQLDKIVSGLGFSEIEGEWLEELVREDREEYDGRRRRVASRNRMGADKAPAATGKTSIQGRAG